MHVVLARLLSMDVTPIAIDCEMVGIQSEIHTQSQRNAVVRVTLVDFDGKCLLDLIIKPYGRIIDPRTSLTGISLSEIESDGVNPDFAIARIMCYICPKRTLLIGCNIWSDLESIGLTKDIWPRSLTRDIQECEFLRIPGRKANERPSLAALIDEHLPKHLSQMFRRYGGHNSYYDAYMTMALYRKVHREWENAIQSSYFPSSSLSNTDYPRNKYSSNKYDDLKDNNMNQNCRSQNVSDFAWNGNNLPSSTPAMGFSNNNFSRSNNNNSSVPPPPTYAESKKGKKPCPPDWYRHKLKGDAKKRAKAERIAEDNRKLGLQPNNISIYDYENVDDFY